MIKNLVIYHKNCMDGMAAAYAASENLDPDKTLYLPKTYGEFIQPEEVDLSTLDYIYILDFSFKRDYLQILCLESGAPNLQVVVIDHHKTAQADLEGWDNKPDNLRIIFDMTRSGAQLAAIHFDTYDRNHVKILVDYVGDRDLWKFELRGSKNINAYIALVPFTLLDYYLLANELEENMYAVAAKGKVLLQQHQKFCEEIIQATKRPFAITGSDGTVYHSYVCNANYQFASEIGNILAKEHGWGATYFQDDHSSLCFSLRSTNESIDVSELAKKYNGGGHRNAAGFKVIVSELVNSSELAMISRGFSK